MSLWLKNAIHITFKYRDSVIYMCMSFLKSSLNTWMLHRDLGEGKQVVLLSNYSPVTKEENNIL